MIQGSDEWRQARLGKVTASRVADVVAKTKTGWSASRHNYAAQLIVERLTGAPMKTFVSAEMVYGTECEPEARAAYSFLYDCDVEECGFIPHPGIPMSGASPDGLIGDDGLIEIKCPNTWTHFDMVLRGAVDGAYVKQAQWQLACTGRAWCDFVSYDKRVPEHMRLYVKRIPRDPALIRELEIEVVAFLAEVDGTLAKLAAAFGQKEAAE